jgi:hypothetical protein
LGSGGMFNLAIVHFPFSETAMMSVLLIWPMDLLVGSLTEIIMLVFSVCSLISIPARLSDSLHLF